jgi:ATP-dependent RNA helicase DeaD
MAIEPWRQGAVGAPTPVKERPRRHSKPHVSKRHGGEDERFVKLVLGGGRRSGLQVADIVAAVTSSADLDGEAVRDVLVLDRFSFLSVPEDEADKVIGVLDGRPMGTRSPRSFSLERVQAG